MYVKRMSESPRKGKKPQVPPLRYAPVGMTILFLPENPGLKSETWATHHFLRSAAVLRLAQVWQGRCFCHDWRVGIELVLAAYHLAGPRGV